MGKLLGEVEIRTVLSQSFDPVTCVILLYVRGVRLLRSVHVLIRRDTMFGCM